MIIATHNKITMLGSDEELELEATLLLISIYNENKGLFKTIKQHITELIESGEIETMGRRIPIE